MRTSLLVLGLAATSLSAAPVPKSLAPPPSLDGTWQLVELHRGENAQRITDHVWQIRGEAVEKFSGRMKIGLLT